MGQMMEYFKYMQKRIPGLKVGTIEMLGFFWVKGKGRHPDWVKRTNIILRWEFLILSYVVVFSQLQKENKFDD